MKELLSGKKTHLAAGLGVLVTLGWLAGLYEKEVMTTLLSLLGFAGLSALRQGIKKALGV